MSLQAKKVHIWQARDSRYALHVCRCDGTLEKQTSCHQTHKVWLKPSSSRRVVLWTGRKGVVLSFASPRQGAKHISIPEPDTYSASQHSRRNSEGETERVCMCERHMCERHVPLSQTSQTCCDSTGSCNMLWLFVKHKRFRCETDVKVVEIQKALTCEC